MFVFFLLLFALRFRSTEDRDVNLLSILVLAGEINSYKHMGRAYLKINPTEKKVELKLRNTEDMDREPGFGLNPILLLDFMVITQ